MGDAWAADSLDPGELQGRNACASCFCNTVTDISRWRARWGRANDGKSSGSWRAAHLKEDEVHSILADCLTLEGGNEIVNVDSAHFLRLGARLGWKMAVGGGGGKWIGMCLGYRPVLIWQGALCLVRTPTERNPHYLQPRTHPFMIHFYPRGRRVRNLALSGVSAVHRLPEYDASGPEVPRFATPRSNKKAPWRILSLSLALRWRLFSLRTSCVAATLPPTKYHH